MDENTQATTAAEDVDNEWLIDVSDMETEDVADDATNEIEEPADSEAAEEEPAPETDTADQQKQPEGEADKEETKAEDKPEETDQFTLKHLDEVKTVSRDEVISLAQKGMDYDRFRSKSEERYNALEQKTEARLAVFDEIAKQGGFKDVDELAENTLAQQLAERDGIDIAAALKQVRLDKRERELAAKEQGLNAAKDAKSKVDADAKAFIDKYPDVDFKNIPKEVWDKVNSGDALVTAYSDYITDKTQKELAAENERLKAEIAAEKKNAENKKHSTGSVTSAGKPASESDLFLKGWASVG